MPTGVIFNSMSILIGGLLGGFFGSKMSDSFKTQLTTIFGSASLAMGIYLIAPMKSMPAVIFSLIIGTAFGLIIHFGDWIAKGAGQIQKGMNKIMPHSQNKIGEAEFIQTFVTVLVLFCASGTGIYGSLYEGMTGDPSILIAKSALDFFTAMIFAASLGFVVCSISVPNFIIFFLLFLLAGFIYPLTTPDMIADFKAVGGILILATGFRILNLKMFPVADMIPAMVVIMPISWAWTNIVMPLLK